MKSLPVVIERASPTHRALQFGRFARVDRLRTSTWSNVVENFSAIRWSVAVTLAVAILGLNIVTGYSGQISIGHSAFFGIGAYTTMILIADHGWPFLATLPVAGALGFFVGAVIGIPALKIRGLYLSLITLGLALAFPAIVKSDNFFGIDFASITGGSNGKVISSGDVTTTTGFHWDPPSWAPDAWTHQRLGVHNSLRHRDHSVRAHLQPDPKWRRSRLDRDARQRDRRSCIGRVSGAVQGAGIRDQRARDVDRWWLLLPGVDDDRPRHVRIAAIHRVHRRSRHRRCGNDPRSGDRWCPRGVAARTGHSRSTGRSSASSKGRKQESSTERSSCSSSSSCLAASSTDFGNCVRSSSCSFPGCPLLRSFRNSDHGGAAHCRLRPSGLMSSSQQASKQTQQRERYQ